MSDHKIESYSESGTIRGPGPRSLEDPSVPASPLQWRQLAGSWGILTVEDGARDGTRTRGALGTPLPFHLL